jgi:hypothetical protein
MEENYLKLKENNKKDQKYDLRRFFIKTSKLWKRNPSPN